MPNYPQPLKELKEVTLDGFNLVPKFQTGSQASWPTIEALEVSQGQESLD